MRNNPQIRANSPEIDRDWLRGVSGDGRLSILHRLSLIAIGLHRRSLDVVASETGIDRASVLKAVDLGIRFGWLVGQHGGRVPRNFAFSFPSLIATAHEKESPADARAPPGPFPCPSQPSKDERNDV